MVMELSSSLTFAVCEDTATLDDVSMGASTQGSGPQPGEPSSSRGATDSLGPASASGA